MPSVVLAVVVVGGLVGSASGAMAAPQTDDWSIDPTPSITGLSGLIRIPTAEIIPANRWRLQYTPPMTLGPEIGSSTSSAAAFSLFPRFEVSASLGSDAQGRDLLYHAKYQIRAPSVGRIGVAIGLLDGNKVQGQRSGMRFLVGTLPLADRRTTLTLGLANGSLDGVLGGVAYRAARWVDVQAEYDTRRLNAGVVVRAGSYAYVRLADTAKGPMLTTAVQLPFEYPRSLASADVDASRSTGGGDSPTTRAQADLVALGFEDVQVRIEETAGRRALVGTVENRRFTLNDRDGAQAALRCLARHAPEGTADVAVELSRRGIVLARATADARAAAGEALVVPRIATLPDFSATAISERTDVANRSWGHADVLLGVGLKTVIGSETGHFRLGASAQPEVNVPVARGLLVNARWSYPVLRDLLSDVPPRLVNERAVAAYAFRPGGGWLAQVSAGRYPSASDGAVLEIARPVLRGSGLVRLIGGRAENDRLQSRPYLLGEYWQWFAGSRVQLRLLGGQFLTNDRGVGIDIYRWHGDVRVGGGVRNTSRTGTAFLSVSLPLSPRVQRARPSAVRLRLADRVEHASRTTTEYPNYLYLLDRAAGELSIGPDICDQLLDRTRLLSGSGWWSGQ